MRYKHLKSEKDLFDEEIENWPIELEKEVEEINRKFNLLYENKSRNFQSLEDIRKYYNSVPWDDFVKEWIK